VTGDVKLEAPPVSGERLRRRRRAELGLSEDDKVVVCGSTHEGEEALWLTFFASKYGAKLALAPRHPNRFESVAALIQASGKPVVRRSERRKWGVGEVFLLDSVGELGDFYAVADLAFVGGSLVPRGGHNLLEPILRGVPVSFGPYVANFRAQRDLILENGLGRQFSDPNQQNEDIWEWLDAPQMPRAEFELRVETALAAHRGAARAMAREIGKLINHRDTEAQRQSL
jgi:3-deoxy-D-manno-octulosonic-acid transferase